jgi:trigger factor
VADGDVAKMRQEIKENLEREVKNRVQLKLKEQVLEVLINNTPVELPRALLDMEIQRMAEQMQRDLEMRGIASKSMDMKPEMFADQATKRVKLGLILAQLVVAHDLKASPDQVRKKVDEHAQSYEKPDEVVGWYYSKPEHLAEVESLVLEDNVVEWVLGRVKVNDKAMSLDELMGVKQ